MRIAAIACLIYCLLGKAVACEVPPPPESANVREQYTCEDEEKLFRSWATMAGRDGVEQIRTDFPELRIVEVPMADNRVVRGVTFQVDMPSSNAILIIGGNAWSSRSVARYVLPYFSPYDVDVYYFDFRGYGMSVPAVSSIHAILEDYRELSGWLHNKHYAKIFVYSFSFGGLVALASFPSLSPFDRVIIDSTPSRGSDFGFVCNPPYEPVDLLPQDCKRLTVMHGTSDWVVPRKFAKELIEKAQLCGAEIDIQARRGHPFQIEWSSSRRKRVEAIMDHFNIRRRQE